MPTSTRRSPTSAVAAPSSKCAPRSMQPRTRKEAAMNYVPQINRRSFVVSAAALGGGLALGIDIPLGPNVVPAPDGSPEVTPWGVNPPPATHVVTIPPT